MVLCGCAGVSHKSSPAQTPAPTALTYDDSTAVYTQGIAIAENRPTIIGGVPTSYSATPSLPAGIVLNSTTGVVTGTPIKQTALTIYTITASNSAGSTTTPLSITVNIAPPTGLAYSTPRESLNKVSLSTGI
jgi:hypothetical protein